MKTIPYLFFILILMSCNMKDKQNFDKTKFHELHQHEGSTNYEIETIYAEKYEVFEPSLHHENQKIITYGRTNPLNKNDVDSKRFKTTPMGNISAEGPIDAGLMKDGSLFGFDFYYNWIIDGDTAKYRYLDPFSGQKIKEILEFRDNEKDSEKWMGKFRDFYGQASNVYVDKNNSNRYYLKVEDRWFMMYNSLEETPDNLKELYPPKEDQHPKMIDLPDLAPKNFHRPKNSFDTDLIKMIGYESQFFEKEDQGLGSYGFSAGWWYLEIYMPLGDTLRIKRYSNYEDPELSLYKVPSAHGGREDVLFIVQKPEELFPEQVGGMYVIRPRDPEQPEKRYSRVSRFRRPGEDWTIRSAEETKAYKEWKQKTAKSRS